MTAAGREGDIRAVKRALGHRCSTKRFDGSAIDRRADGTRAYPSAHARYDVRVTVAAGRVDGLPAGLYTGDHAELVVASTADVRDELAAMTLDAPWIAHCPAVIVLSADLAAASAAFIEQGPARGPAFCFVEAGAIAQNIALAAGATGLGTAFIGGLRPGAEVPPAVADGRTVIGLMPIGVPDQTS